MVSAKDNLLMTVLGCGSLDLEMLEDVHYDFGEIVDQLDGIPLQKAGFNGLMRAVVDVGIIHIQEAVGDRCCELEAVQMEREWDEDEAEEYRLIELLDPDNDIRSYHNYLDTSAWFERRGEIYREYLSEAIDSFEENTGIPLTGGE
jgi:hypothetical protein